MAQVGIKIIFGLSLFCLTSKAEEELSPGIVYDLLSRRLDYVIQETNNLKSELAETKSAVIRIENKIENIEATVSASTSGVNKQVQKMSESLKNDKIVKVEEMSESLINNKINRQSVAVRKMLFNEKKLSREIVQKFENKFLKFESDIKSELALINVSMESSIDSLEKSMTKHKIETNTSFMFTKIDLQNMLNETDLQIEIMNIEFRNMINDSAIKLKRQMEMQTKMKIEKLRDHMEEFQAIHTRTTSDLQKAENGFNDRLNNAETRLSSMSSKLDSLERHQESKEDTFDEQISRLSSRISKEEARKVAFSARLVTKQSYYGASERIVFDEVIYSYGGGYSTFTGIYTAPKSGTYLFTYNIKSTEVGNAHVVLQINGNTATRALADKGIAETGGNAGIAYIWKGEQVWVQTASLQDKYYIWPYRTTFNGILID